MKKILLGLTLFLGFIAQNAFATLPDVNTSPNEQWRVEINQSSPANTRTQLGTRLEGPLQTGATTVTTTGTALPCGGDSGQKAYASPNTKTYIQTMDLSTHGMSYCLGDGYAGQSITFALVSTGNSNKLTITPKTKTAFANVQLTAALASVEFTYSDTTTGWVISGTTPTGATVN